MTQPNGLAEPGEATSGSKRRSLLLRYGVAAVATILATLLRMALDPWLGKTAPFTLYYAAVTIAAWYSGLVPSLLTLVAGGLLASHFFIDPEDSLLISDLEHQIGMGLYLAVGVIVSLLSESLHANRRRVEAARIELAEKNRELQKEIAERAQAERWLLESEQRFRGYFEQGLAGMAILSADEQWIEVNPRVCQVLGYTPEELMAKRWADLVHPDDLESDRTNFRQMRERTVSGYVVEQRFLRKDGSTLYTSLAVQCMRKGDGSVDCILALAKDITKRVTAEEAALAAQQQLLEQQRSRREQIESELAKVKEQLVRQTRLATMGQVSASIAHDLRNSLFVINGATYLLKRCPPENRAEMVEQAKLIDCEIETIGRIIANLMELARAKEPACAEVALGELVRDVFDRIQHGPAVGLRTEFSPQPFHIKADPAQLRQVLGNLMANSVDAMPEGGEIRLVGRRDGDFDAIVLEDDGPGVPAELREQIFEPLVSGKPKGTGLGLAICRQIVERHGGTIELVDTARHGAAFQIRLPAAPR